MVVVASCTQRWSGEGELVFFGLTKHSGIMAKQSLGVKPKVLPAPEGSENLVALWVVDFSALTAKLLDNVPFGFARCSRALFRAPAPAATHAGKPCSAPPTRSTPTLCPQTQPSELRSRTLGFTPALLVRLAAGARDRSAPDGPQLAPHGLPPVLALEIPRP